MSEQKIYNIVTLDSKESGTLEVLQASKLHTDGSVEFLNLEGMTAQRAEKGTVTDWGNPFKVDLNPGEFVLLVTRLVLVGRHSGSSIRVQLLNDDGILLTLVNGFYGNPDRPVKKGWIFPTVNRIMHQYESLFDPEEWPTNE